MIEHLCAAIVHAVADELERDVETGPNLADARQQAKVPIFAPEGAKMGPALPPEHTYCKVRAGRLFSEAVATDPRGRKGYDY